MGLGSKKKRRQLQQARKAEFEAAPEYQVGHVQFVELRQKRKFPPFPAFGGEPGSHYEVIAKLSIEEAEGVLKGLQELEKGGWK